jgi:hypothetical protein
MKARHRRRAHFVVFILALIPGGILSLLFSRSLAWIVFMSWFAMVYAPLSAFAAETPVEEEA